jgi:hypothetical protein
VFTPPNLALAIIKILDKLKYMHVGWLLVLPILTVSALGMVSYSASAEESGFHTTVIPGVSYGLGTIKNKSDTIKSRSINTVFVHALLGLGVGPVTIGGMGQYRFVGQITDPKKVDDTNMSGVGYYAGPALAIGLGPIVFQVAYDLAGDDHLLVETEAHEQVVYSKPSGFTALLGVLLGKSLLIDLHFSSHNFSQVSNGQVKHDITDDKMTEIHYGAGIGVEF